MALLLVKPIDKTNADIQFFWGGGATTTQVPVYFKEKNGNRYFSDSNITAV
jgi:hypothetical protein